MSSDPGSAVAWFGRVALALALFATACSSSVNTETQIADGVSPSDHEMADSALTPALSRPGTEPVPDRTASADPDPSSPDVTVSPAPTVAPTQTPPPTVPVSPTATPLPTGTPLPTATPQPVGPCDAGPLALPNPDRPVYQGTMVIDPPDGTISGVLDIEFVPDLDIDAIYLRLWPNGPRPAAGGVAITIDDVTIDGVPVEPESLAPTIRRLPLGRASEPGGGAMVHSGETVRIGLSYQGTVPSELKSRLSGRDDYMRLGTFLPLLPWEAGRGWALDPATSLFAEAVSSPVADYSITVTVPDGYDVLASGTRDQHGTWSVKAARDFALSVGRFTTFTGVAMAPSPVQVTVGVHETIGDDGSAYLAKIIDSLEQFSRRWGQYPWPSLTFALTPNLAGGIEFPTHIMQGPNTIGRTTSHEVGHMFFYSLVGNNQGSEPWLDEGITSYAEFTYEGVGAGAYPIPAEGQGNATQPMTFWESRPDMYYRSVYGQTGFALLRLGSRDDVDCALARYVAANAHQIATAEDFVAAFEPIFPDVVSTLAEFGVVLVN